MQNQKKKRPVRNVLAQSMSEIAIFGAVIIFISGVILRTGFGNSLQMNQDLRTMRYAMQQSYLSGRRLQSKRNSATVLLVEDRLDIDSRDKFGSRERIPFMTSASATYSQNLFMPNDYGRANELPVMDMFINGRHLELRTAGYRTYTYGPPGLPGNVRMPLCPNTAHFENTGDEGPYGICWDPGCFFRGCARVKKRIANYPSSSEWCSPSYHPGRCGGPGSAAMNRRFDLDFSGLPLDAHEPHSALTLAEDCATPGDVRSEQDCFFWQWKDVPMIIGQVDIENGVNTQLDVDGDYKMETILGIGFSGGSITAVQTVDSGLGDIAVAWDDRDDWRAREIAEANGQTPPGPLQPGLQMDSTMYSFGNDGTLYRVEEGQLFNPSDGQYVRQTNMQEQIDIIERTINITPQGVSRLCDWVTQTPRVGFIEACGDCFNNANFNVQKTCVDRYSNKIFVRSRLSDRRGRRWVTRMGDR